MGERDVTLGEERLFLDTLLLLDRGGLDGGGVTDDLVLTTELSNIGLSSSRLELKDDDTDEVTDGVPYTANDFLLKAGEYLGISGTEDCVFQAKLEILFWVAKEPMVAGLE